MPAGPGIARRCYRRDGVLGAPRDKVRAPRPRVQAVDETETSLQDKVKLLEHAVYPAALALVAGGSVVWDTQTNKVTRS